MTIAFENEEIENDSDENDVLIKLNQNEKASIKIILACQVKQIKLNSIFLNYSCNNSN